MPSAYFSLCSNEPSVCPIDEYVPINSGTESQNSAVSENTYYDSLLIDNTKDSAVDDVLRFLSTSKYSSISAVRTLLAVNKKISSTEFLEHPKHTSCCQEFPTYTTFGGQLSDLFESHIPSKSSPSNSLNESIIFSQIAELMTDLSEEAKRSLVDCLLLSAPSGRSALGPAIEYLKAHGVEMPAFFATCEHLNNIASIPKPLPHSDKSSQHQQQTLTSNSSTSSSPSFPFWSPSTEQNFQYFLDWMHGSNHNKSFTSDEQNEKMGTDGEADSCGVFRRTPVTTALRDNKNDKNKKKLQQLHSKRTAAASSSYSNHRLVLPSRKKARGTATTTTTTTTVFVDQEQRLTRGDFSAISFLADIADHMLLVDELKAK